MNYMNDMLEFNEIIQKLKEYTRTGKARDRFEQLAPIRDERELNERLRDTSEAKILLEKVGNPPISSVEDIFKITENAKRGDLLSIDELEKIELFAVACMRFKKYLKRSEDYGLNLSGYGNGMYDLDFLKEEISKCIRNKRVDDYASKELKEIRKKLEQISSNIRLKLENLLKSKKECFSDSFISNRNGHFTLPVKKEHKLTISGSVIDMSSSGATYFIEPTAVAKLKEEYENKQIEESNEERKILYILSSFVGDLAEEISLNLEYIEELDYIFAKGKLSMDMNGVAPTINTNQYIELVNGRHPLLKRENCVPLNIKLGNLVQGIVITGPNTGGKTVALKTVGLLSVMANCGLHVPCESASICMNSNVLCDIGDNQSISENLSTFSAHIKNIIEIIKRIDKDSLVFMDELGSGTDPSEGMGIAIAILEELRKSGCLFIVTTHYPEVKEYAEKTDGIMNARMAFDKESLRPLYRLEVGVSGESCALYIAKQLGMPRNMLLRAYEETYQSKEVGRAHRTPTNHIEKEILEDGIELEKEASKDSEIKIVKYEEKKPVNSRASRFEVGDSVVVYPQKKVGIVFEKADSKGYIGVQIQKKKEYVIHKRVQLKASAKDLYPEDYNMSIIFDSVETRKTRRVMEKRHEEGREIHYDAVKKKGIR
ncbi:endonuclease MutS2 [Anaeromicropila herbilytica]|uniref:Endonuclease MutS2 n=1 Tax=Anaeromicropila herbilytica TaxID=2785025 RepID=A0A7R7EJK2_9FIRM|nr:DNA mismatch repair protein MutS [Anaeromicropila herbilytica]BCN30011.1 endonuclease MutS2 [Anaeromicropila herbilytica]